MVINESRLMADAILENNRIISLLPRFDIEFGFGELTVDEVCRASGVNTAFFLEIVNSYINDDYVVETDFSLFSLSTVVEYLKKTHTNYLKVELPEIENKIHSLINNSCLSDDKKNLVITFFNDYKQEFIVHIMNEEDDVLPYILEIEKQVRLKDPEEDFIKKLETYSIHQFAHEHDRLEDSLANLAALIIKYLPPFKDRALCDQTLSSLFVLKEDLIDHATMEDKVLVPKVADLEKELLHRYQS
jgi:regulator of cell morphogenesis and NO signaling